MSETAQIFVMGFGAFLATAGMVLFALFLWFKNESANTHKVTFFRFGIETSQPALLVFFVGCALIVTPLFVGTGNAGLLVDNPTPAPTSTAGVPASGASPTPFVEQTGTGDGEQAPPTPTPATAGTVTAFTLAGEWRLASETVSGQPTFRAATLTVEAVDSREAEFIVIDNTGGIYFGWFEIQGDRLIGVQSDFSFEEPLDARFTYSRSGGAETLELIMDDSFSTSQQVWTR